MSRATTPYVGPRNVPTNENAVPTKTASLGDKLDYLLLDEDDEELKSPSPWTSRNRTNSSLKRDSKSRPNWNHESINSSGSAEDRSNWNHEGSTASDTKRKLEEQHETRPEVRAKRDDEIPSNLLPFICVGCGKRFTTRANTVRHQKLAKKCREADVDTTEAVDSFHLRYLPVECEICGQSVSKMLLPKHQRSKACMKNGVGVAKTDDNEIESSGKDKEVKGKSDEDAKWKYTLEVNQATCCGCGKGFTTKTNAERHQKLSLKCKEASIKTSGEMEFDALSLQFHGVDCDACGKKVDKAKLDEHKNSQECYLECDSCGKKVENSNLDEHKRCDECKNASGQNDTEDDFEENDLDDDIQFVEMVEGSSRYADGKVKSEKQDEAMERHMEESPTNSPDDGSVDLFGQEDGSPTSSETENRVEEDNFDDDMDETRIEPNESFFDDQIGKRTEAGAAMEARNDSFELDLDDSDDKSSPSRHNDTLKDFMDGNSLSDVPITKEPDSTTRENQIDDLVAEEASEKAWKGSPPKQTKRSETVATTPIEDVYDFYLDDDTREAVENGQESEQHNVAAKTGQDHDSSVEDVFEDFQEEASGTGESEGSAQPPSKQASDDEEEVTDEGSKPANSLEEVESRITSAFLVNKNKRKSKFNFRKTVEEEVFPEMPSSTVEEQLDYLVGDDDEDEEFREIVAAQKIPQKDKAKAVVKEEDTDDQPEMQIPAELEVSCSGCDKKFSSKANVFRHQRLSKQCYGADVETNNDLDADGLSLQYLSVDCELCGMRVVKASLPRHQKTNACREYRIKEEPEISVYEPPEIEEEEKKIPPAFGINEHPSKFGWMLEQFRTERGITSSTWKRYRPHIIKFMTYFRSRGIDEDKLLDFSTEDSAQHLPSLDSYYNQQKQKGRPFDDLQHLACAFSFVCKAFGYYLSNDGTIPLPRKTMYMQYYDTLRQNNTTKISDAKRGKEARGSRRRAERAVNPAFDKNFVGLAVQRYLQSDERKLIYDQINHLLEEAKFDKDKFVKLRRFLCIELEIQGGGNRGDILYTMTCREVKEAVRHIDEDGDEFWIINIANHKTKQTDSVELPVQNKVLWAALQFYAHSLHVSAVEGAKLKDTLPLFLTQHGIPFKCNDPGMMELFNEMAGGLEQHPLTTKHIRAFVATWMNDEGIPLHEAARMMNHSPAVHLRYYLQGGMAKKQKTAKKFLRAHGEEPQANHNAVLTDKTKALIEEKNLQDDACDDDDDLDEESAEGGEKKRLMPGCSFSKELGVKKKVRTRTRLKFLRAMPAPYDNNGFNRTFLNAILDSPADNQFNMRVHNLVQQHFDEREAGNIFPKPKTLKEAGIELLISLRAAYRNNKSWRPGQPKPKEFL